MLDRLLCKNPAQVLAGMNNVDTQISTLDTPNPYSEFEHDFRLARIPVDHETQLREQFN